MSTVAPPQNLDAECAVLGAVLLGTGSIVERLIETGLQPEHFYREAHGVVWEAMCELARAGRGIDCLVLTEFLRQTGRLDYVGGPGAVDALTGAVPAVSNAVEYARIVVKLWTWRRRLRAAWVMQEAAEAMDERAWTEAWTSVAP